MHRRARILGTGHYAPSKVVTNDDLTRTLDTTEAWIVERTGIKTRRIAAEGELTSDMALAASKRALEAAELDAKDIDLILLATFTGDSPLPASAVHLQHKLGARTIPALDVQAACTGFVVGLDIAEQFIRTGSAKRVLVVGAEMLSRVTDWTDRGTAVLFGDGAGAAILGPSEDDARGILATRTFSDGSLAALLEIPAGGVREPLTLAGIEQHRNTMKMDGQAVFRAAVKSLGNAATAALAAAGVAASEVDWVVPHQANLRILTAVSERLGVPMERFVLNLAEYGNTSSASIPIALDEAIRDGRIRPGHRVLLSAFGAGFVWGASVIRM